MSSLGESDQILQAINYILNYHLVMRFVVTLQKNRNGFLRMEAFVNEYLNRISGMSVWTIEAITFSICFFRQYLD